MKRLSLMIFALAVMALSASAIPAKPGQVRTLTLSNGTTVKAQLVGDEHGHYWLSQDGRAYQQVEGMAYFTEVSLDAMKVKAQTRRSQSNARRAKRLAPRRVGEVGGITGKKRGLIILVNYSDVAFKAAHNNALFQRIANEENFNYGKFKGSMYDYFYAQSEGQFELTFDVAGPVTVSNTQSYYGRNNSEGDDMHPAEMVIEALKLADDEVNFADYDWDGDGEVEQVYVVYAGKGEADGGASVTIWPHEWYLSAANYYGDGDGAQMLDGVKIDTYACGGELNGQTGDIDGIGTMCHEFSHCLGYPDFYDTGNGGNQGMGYWDLMDSGSYNGDGYQPAGYTSYERWMAGWREPIELGEEPLEVTGMKSLQEGGDFYIMYNEGHRDEYYLLENRQKTSWDASLPGSGLLILHVDYDSYTWMYNTVNNTPGHQRMTWMAADNKYQYTTYMGTRYYSFSGMTNDPYPYNGNDSFGNDTEPSATLFNKNTDGSKLLNKLVYDIKKNSDGTVSFKYMNEGSSSGGDIEVTGNGDYKRVTSTDELTENATYLIVYEASPTSGTAYAGLNLEGTHYGKKVDVTIEGYTISSDEARPVKLEKAGNDMWYIKDQGEYLYFKGSGNTLDQTEEKGITGTRWTIRTDEIINSDYEVVNRKLQYNKASSGLRFACYMATQQDVVLYMKAGGDEPIGKQDPDLSFNVAEVTTEAEDAEFIAPELVNPHNLTVVYSSSDETLATVDAETGEVTIGSEPGTVTITASFAGDDNYYEGSASYTIIITEKVFEKQDPDLSFNVAEVTTEAEDAEFIAPELENPHNLAVVYSSSDESLATVDAETGEVTIGSEPGTVTITASFVGDDNYYEGSASYMIIITEKPIVKQDADLSFSVAEVTTEAEDAEFIAPELVNPHNLTVVYSSSDESLATVDAETGEVTIGSEPGTVTITASFAGDDYFNEGSASYMIIITEKPIVKQDPDLSFNVAEVTTEAEDAEFIAPELVNPHELAVVYSSSDETLATVDAETGEVTIGSEPGTVTITASFAGDDYFNEGSASYIIIITEKPIVKQDADLSFSVAEVTTEAENAEFIAPELVNPHELAVVYSSSDESLATVNAETGEVTIGSEPGTVIITALFAGNDYFNEGSASYTIVITEKVDLGIRELLRYMSEGTAVFDLQGRRVSARSLRKGFYIVNGKKVVIK